jgi:NADPH:quinone reductase-like Zn-dependent oxidoreductase
MKAYIYPKLGLENLTLVERDVPKPEAHHVLIQFHAASLNYRDLLFAYGQYNPKPNLPAIPLCDGAGEIVALGEGVTRWKVGDRVFPIFMQGWIDGPITNAKARTAIGAGELDGTLCEYGAFHEEGLVRIPEHLSYNEAATLPCAAVTAWHALVSFGKIKPGDTVLTLGTGGVSVFALPFAKLFGARVIATSSSDEKLARVRTMGADETINYKRTPEWDREVLRLTDKVGVDHVVEVGGAGTLPRSIHATRMEGLISLIGVLSRGEGVEPMKILMKSLLVKGILVGSREMFEAMNAAITKISLKPVVDQVFGFGEATAALKRMESGSHFGKIVIEIG